MPTLLFGVLLLVILLWGSKAFTKLDPKQLTPLLRYLGGFAALAAAAFLVVRGALALAVPLGLVGLSMLGWTQLGGFGPRRDEGRGRVSRVRSAFLEMELDHATGAMRGQILSGQYQGTALDTLPVETLAALVMDIDAESRALLIAYLDRRHPGWSEHTQADPTAGRRAPAASGKMTEQEAYQILGVQPGASTEEIGRAHRTLMKKLHPDQGGSTYLAARVNEAKEVLLRRHR
ncbi:MAG: DnaJ domain-containing protein [Xanthobacteraceae bacterium]